MSNKPDYVLGIDPDTKNSAVVLVNNRGPQPWVVDAALAVVGGRKAEHRLAPMGVALRSVVCSMVSCVPVECTVACVVESQAIRPTDPRPNDILNLAIVAGMAYAMCLSHAQRWGLDRPVLVLPQVWKGTIQKAKHQEWLRRTADSSSLARLTKVAGGTKRVSHLLDAYGIARWLSEKTSTGTLLPF